MEIKTELDKDTIDRLNFMATRLAVSRDHLISHILEKTSESAYLNANSGTDEKTSFSSLKLGRIGILGCNAVSRGIAKVMAQKGVRVEMVGFDKAELDRTLVLLQRNLDWMIQKWELTETEKKILLQQIHPTTLMSSLHQVDILFDTIRGPLSMRFEIYRDLSKALPETTTIAIDDPTCPLTDLAVRIAHPERVIGYHFTYPVSRRKIIEIMKADQTSDFTVQRMKQIAQFLDKEIIEVIESSGGISTRIMIPYLNEAINLWAEGLASAKEIDQSLKYAMNLNMGPLEYADTIGLDVVLNTSEALFKNYSLPQFKIHPRIKHLVKMGFLGKKTGIGIHVYDESKLGEAL